MSTVLHPNGFVQHDLDDGVRMHIWHPNLPKAQTVYTPIHDHAFDFLSSVIVGQLTHRTFFVSPARKKMRRPSPDAHLFLKHHVKGPDLVPSGDWVYVEEQHTMRFRQGDSYEFGGPGHYHMSEGYGLTVTLMRKHPHTYDRVPHVLVPKGWKPDNEFRRDQYSEEVLRPFVDMALEAVKKWPTT